VRQDATIRTFRLRVRFCRTAAQLVCVGCLTVGTARAGRPFIIDDAGVVGRHHLQLETWLYLDKDELDHIVAVGFGPTDWLEFAAAGLYGVTLPDPGGVGFMAPIVQAKALVLEPSSWPGLAVAVGTLPPLGRGHLEPSGWAGYAYAAATWTALEPVALHFNAGGSVLDDGDEPDFGTVIGLAVSVQVIEEVAVFGEIFRGDAYDARNDSFATHGGVYWAANESLQLDLTAGTTLPPLNADPGPAQPWATLGLKLVTAEL